MNLLQKNLDKYHIQSKNDTTTMNHPQLFSEYILSTTPRERYTRRFLEYIPAIENLTYEQKSCLEEFGQTLEYMDEQLKPFRDHGIHYTLNLAGGAVRDFLLGKQDKIKDHDVFVFFYDDTYIGFDEQQYYPQISLQLAKEICGEDILLESNKEFTEKDIAKHILQQTCLKLLQKNNTITHYYNELDSSMDNSSYKKEDYLNNAMFGNIKINNTHNKKPIDLVLCKIPSHHFTSTFDFGICKAAINYRDINTYGKISPSFTFKTNTSLWENVYDNLLIDHAFLRDVEQNTISINIGDFTPEHIEYFMNKHFLKLKEKYPEKELKLWDRYNGYRQQEFQAQYMKMKNLEIPLPGKKNHI